MRNLLRFNRGAVFHGFRLILWPTYIPLLALLSLGSAFSQVSTQGVTIPPNYGSFLPPAAGAVYVDPAFGSTIRRVSSALSTPNNASGGTLPWIGNEYSTMSAFNNDNSRFILVHESYFGLYDGAGVFLRDLPLQINSSSEPRWSRKDLVTLYYHTGNQIKSYNTGSGATTVLHTFSEYSAITGNGEMDISLDGDHLIYCGDNQFVFVYEISSDRKFRQLDAGPRYFDSIYLTPTNNVILTWVATGSTRYSGQELFDINMNFLRQVGHANGHKDVTVDTNGDEVLVWNNSNDPLPIPNCNNGLVKIRLADGTQTCLAQFDWSLAMHVSGPDRNGSVFVSTEAPSNPNPGTTGWVAYTNEILQVKLDGSGVTRWAHHRSRPVNSYNWQPRLSSSRDGTRLLYSSNFNLAAILGNSTEYTDTYLLAVGAQAIPRILWPAPAAISYGTALSAAQLNGTADVPGVFIYTPPAGTVLVAGSGHTLSARFTPADSAVYAPTTATTTIVVNRAKPAIAWPSPAAITFGGALGSGQLNASASVPGLFAYTPPAGTVIPVGNAQALSVLFTASDAANYAPATASTTINVNPAAATPANLVVTRVLTRTANTVNIRLTIANTGGSSAVNVVVTSVKVGSETGTPLPQSLGLIGAGTTAVATVTVPASVGPSGASGSFTLSGTYTGGTFSATARITLP